MSLRNFEVVDSFDKLQRYVDRALASETSIAFDIETGYLGPDREKSSLHPETAILVGISFTESVHYAQYVPLGHDTGPNLDNRQAARILWPMLASGRGVAHNAGFELRHLSKWFRDHLSDDPEHGEAVRAAGGYFPIRSDTQVEAYVMAEYQKFGLKYLTKIMFGHEMTELHELFPGLKVNRRKMLRFNTLELTEQVRDYACEDSCWCLAIHQRYYPQVKDRLVYKIDMAVLQCLCEMEEYGVRYDWNFMRQAAETVREFKDRLNAEIMTELSEMAGTPVGINLASPAQIGKVLYETLGFKTTVYTKSTQDLPPEERKMSTGRIALARLAKRHPVVKKIQNWKELTKLNASYLDKYEAQYNYAPDGHAHPNHLSAVVVTGRFAHQDPNYAQSPRKYHFDLEPAKGAHADHAAAHGSKCDCGEFAPPDGTCFTFNFRDAIAAPPEHYILGFDLSQAELRAIAGEANETALLDAFAKGEDVHTLTASLMLGVPAAEITKELRAIGKTFNFALLYGMGVKSLADRLAIPVDEAQSLYDGYFAAYPGIAEWTRKQVELGKRQGYVASKFGRRLPIWNFQSDKKWIREQGERQCVNFPIQGCLPSDTRVLTRGGWVPIGEFEDGVDVWTGAEWAPAIRLAMGVAPRVRLHLSDGRTFDCDNRHRLLVKADPWPEWKLVTEAKGLPLCQDQNTDWGGPDGSTVEDWYWVGRFVGDGSLHRSGQGHVRWSLAFDGVKEAEDIERFKAWLGDRFAGGTCSKLGYGVDDGPIRRGTGKGVKVVGGTKAGVAFWLAHGIEVGARAKTLRIPDQVFRLDRARREAFCEGYLDADGNSRHDGRETYWSKLTSASRAGLEDMLRLFQTIGRTGRIGKPVVFAGRGAGGSDYVFWDLWLQRAPKDLVIEDIEYLPEEPMYTLSVDHPRHAFSTEGLISKNSATGDYMRYAMVRARKALREAGMHDRVHMVMNVHDALEFYVHRSLQPIDVIRVLEPAVVYPVKGWPAMQADWHVAKTWGSPVELSYKDGILTVKGNKDIDLMPTVEVDEETGEEVVDLPEIDADALRRVAARHDHDPYDRDTGQFNGKPAFDPQTGRPRYGAGKHVIVTLSQMPTEAGYERFLHMLDNLPGPNTLTLRTPEGDLPIDLPVTGTALEASHTAAVSLILGPVRITYDAADINAADMLQGLTL